MEIPIQKKKQIEQLSEFIVRDYCNGYVTDLASIAFVEDITCYYDHYEKFFDGMLLFDGSRFHIHLNIDRGNAPQSKRSRFTCAHELGHYFLDEHREGLRSGKFKPHPSFANLVRNNLIEMEADYFASCLLIPAYKLRDASPGKGFSFETVINLSDTFQTSILATLIRFAEVGFHEIFVVVSKDNIVKWFLRSTDFPKYPFRFKVGSKLPPTTVAGEFFTKEDAKYSEIETVYVEDWFYAKNGDRELNEQCLYMDQYGYVISLIWFD